jgi:hypothetical protein
MIFLWGWSLPEWNKGKLPALRGNRLERKLVTMANTQFYFDTVLIKTVNSSIVQASVACSIKVFTVVNIW